MSSLTSACLRDFCHRLVTGAVLVSLPLFLLQPAPAASQERDPARLLAHPAHLSVEDTLLQDALRALHRSSGVSIAFSPDLLPSALRVSCACTDHTVGEALRLLLAETELTFEATRTLVRIIPPPPPEVRVPVNAGTLAGTLTQAETGGPVVNGMVRLGEGRGTFSDEDGHFVLAGIAPGEYELTVSGLGWEPRTLEGIQIERDRTTAVEVSLHPLVIPLGEMVVAPSRYGILKDPLVADVTLTREDVRALPQLGEDLFRAVGRLPGISTNDFTAKLFMRGSRSDEVITLFDGLELHEPYHLKQWEAILSILDAESVGSVDLLTGGFPVEYGDRSAGVFSMESVEPLTDRTHTTVGASFMNLSLRNQGGFDDGKGSWFVTARRGFMDVVFKLANVEEDFDPAYYDVFGKVQYELSPGHRVSARVLHAADNLHGVEDDLSQHDDRYGSSYLWLTYENTLFESLTSRTILSASRILKDRHGQDFDGDGALKTLDVTDRLEAWYLGLKSDWSWEVSPRVVFKGGAELRPGWTDYAYFRWRSEWFPNFNDPIGPAFYLETDTLDMALKPAGFDVGAYAGTRVRVTEALTADGGVRFHNQSRTGASQLSPRVSASYRLLPQTIVRAAWGHYPQVQALHELQVADADSVFHPAQDAEHRILGIEHIFPTGISIRLEAFDRRTADPLPEYRNLVDKVEAVWEEGPGDRVTILPEKRRAQGIELYARGPLTHRAAWSVGYSLSRAQDYVDGAWQPRPQDQRHATLVHLAVRPTPTWTLTTVWQARTGWPASEQVYEIETLATGDAVIKNEFGTLYGLRLPSYERLDLRVSKRFDLSVGRLFLNLDLFNALGRENPQSLQYDLVRFDPYLRLYQFETQVDTQIPRLVTLGLRWEF